MVSRAPILQSITSFDTAALATPARSGLAVSKPPAGFTTAKVPLPSLGAAALSTRLADIRARKNLVDPNAAEIKRAGSDKDLQAAFTVHRALDGLRTLAQAASAKSVSAVTRTQLQNQFAAGVAEIETYLAKAPTNKLILQFGAKVSRAESAPVAKIPTAYTGASVVKGARADSIPGITGAEQFILTLSKAGRSDTVAINISEITGPVTLDAVKSFINNKIAALPLLDANNDPVRDGNSAIIPRYASRLDVVRTNTIKEIPATFALRADTSITEQLSFVETNATPSAYILRTTDGATALRRIDDIATSAAQNPVANLGALTASASVVDASGAIYVVGTTKNDIGGQSATLQDDIFLAKYDSNGQLQFARKLGAAGTAHGAAIAIDSGGNIIVGGDFNGKLGKGDVFEGTDGLVIKFNALGEELFARSFDSAANDSITGISIAPDDSIVVTGTVVGALPGQAQSGLSDNFTAVLNSSTGTIIARQQFGTSSADTAAVIAHTADGTLVQASAENGDIIVRGFSGGDISAAPRVFNFGAIGNGVITDVAVDPATGAIAIAGSTTSGGATDGFIARLASDFTLQGITVLGASSARISAVAFSGGDIFASGQTSSALGGPLTGISDSFIARINSTSGVIDSISQSGTLGKRSDVRSLVIAPQGPGALLKLGLRQGDLRAAAPPALIDKTILRAGDSFDVAINGGAVRTIRVDGDDTLAALATKIRTQLGSSANVSVQENASGTKISISAKSSTRIDLRRGPDGADLLGKLGLLPGQLRDSATLFDIGKTAVEVARTPGGAFALNLDKTAALSDIAASGAALTKIEAALESVQRAYRSLYYDPTREALARERSVKGPVPAYLTQQLSNYQDALARLQSGNSNFGLSS